MPSNSTEDRLSGRSKQRLMILVTVGLIVLMLLGAEAAVRIRQTLKYGSAAMIEDYWTLDPKHGLRVPVAGFSSGRISINSLGFRGPEIAVPKPPGTVRLAFLGASTTWCGEASGNERVWPHLASAALGRAFPAARFDYVNAGVPGYGMGSILKSMQHRVAPLQPDVVVVYEAANNLSVEMRGLAAQRGIVSSATVEEFTWPSRYSVLWSLVEKNLRVLAAQRRALSNRGRIEVDPAMLGERYRRELTEVVLAARQTARLVALATFSIQPRAEQSAEQQMRASTSAFFYMPFVTSPLLIEIYERYNQILREVARDTGVFLIEGENEIPGDPIHFTDTVHFSDAGSEAMTRRIALRLAASPVLQRIVADNTAAR